MSFEDILKKYDYDGVDGASPSSPKATTPVKSSGGFQDIVDKYKDMPMSQAIDKVYGGGVKIEDQEKKQDPYNTDISFKEYMDVSAGNLFSGIARTAGSLEEYTGRTLGLASKYGGNIASGIYGVAGDLVGLFSKKGEATFDKMAEDFKTLGMDSQKTLKQAGRETSHFLTKSGQEAKDIILQDNMRYQKHKTEPPKDFKWSDLGKREFLLYDLYGSFVENAPTMVATLYTAGRAGSIGTFGAQGSKLNKVSNFILSVGGGTTFSLGMNALQESETTYASVLESGGSKDEALKQAERTLERNFKGNLGLEAIQLALVFYPSLKSTSPFLKALSTSGRFVGAGVVEAGQERFEDTVQEQAGEENYSFKKLLAKMSDPNITKTDVISFIMGLAFQGMGNAFVDTGNAEKALEKQAEMILENMDDGAPPPSGSPVDDLEKAINENPTGVETAIRITQEQLQNAVPTIATQKTFNENKTTLNVDEVLAEAKQAAMMKDAVSDLKPKEEAKPSEQTLAEMEKKIDDIFAGIESPEIIKQEKTDVKEVYEKENKVPKDFALSEPYKAGSYLRQDIERAGVGIGHVSYKVDGKIMSLDMVKLDDKTARGKGYAGSALARIVSENKIEQIKPTEDGFTNEGKRFVKNFVEKNGGYFEKNVGYLKPKEEAQGKVSVSENILTESIEKLKSEPTLENLKSHAQKFDNFADFRTHVINNFGDNQKLTSIFKTKKPPFNTLKDIYDSVQEQDSVQQYIKEKNEKFIKERTISKEESQKILDQYKEGDEVKIIDKRTGEVRVGIIRKIRPERITEAGEITKPGIIADMNEPYLFGAVSSLENNLIEKYKLTPEERAIVEKEISTRKQREKAMFDTTEFEVEQYADYTKKENERVAEVANEYWENVTRPQIDNNKTVVIGADDLKDYFGKDYEEKNHKIYSRAAFRLYGKALKLVENKQVIFTGGGPASGKTDFLIDPFRDSEFTGIIYDSNMANYDGVLAQKKMAEEEGKRVGIVGIIPDLDTARKYSILRENEIGRGITDKTFARGHAGFPNVVIKLLENGIFTENQIKILDTRDTKSKEEIFNKIKNKEYLTDSLAILRELGYNESTLEKLYAKSNYNKQTGERIGYDNIESGISDVDGKRRGKIPRKSRTTKDKDIGQADRAGVQGFPNKEIEFIFVEGIGNVPIAGTIDAETKKITFNEDIEKYQTQIKQDIYSKGFITNEQALDEALKIPIFKALHARGQVVLAEKLKNPKALGSYVDGVIKFVKNPHETTLPHEAFHAFLDMVLLPTEKQEAIDMVKESGMTDIQAEEKLTQEFAEWYVAQNKKSRLQRFFDKVANFFKEMLGLENEIKSLFYRALDPTIVNKINSFKSNGGIQKLREEYNQNPKEFTIQLFEDPVIWKREFAKRATVIDALGRLKKPLMKDFVANKLETEFKGQEMINTGELKRSLMADLIEMNIIETDKYADYGIANINRNYNTQPKTYIINTNFTHGRKGHFSDSFDVATTKDDLEIRKIEAGTHQVEGQTQRVDKDQYYVVRKDISIENLEEATFGKFDSEKDAQKYIENFATRKTEQAGMFGHFRAFTANDGKEFYVVEMQSDIYQHGLAGLMRTNKRLMDNELSIIDNSIKSYQKTINEAEKRIHEYEFKIDILQKEIKDGKDGELKERIETYQRQVPDIKKNIENTKEFIALRYKERDEIIKKYSEKEGIYFRKGFSAQTGMENLKAELDDKISLYEDQIAQKIDIERSDFEVPSHYRFRVEWNSYHGSTKVIDFPSFFKLAEQYRLEKEPSKTTSIPAFEYMYGDAYSSRGALEMKENTPQWGWDNKTLKEKKEGVAKFNKEMLPRLHDVQKEITKLTEYAKEIENRNKKGLTPQQQKEIMLSEQFLSFKNNYHELIINSAIRQAAVSGAETVYFPSPYTVANVEQYISSNDDNAGSATEQEIRSAGVGGEVDVMGYSGIIADIGGSDYDAIYTEDRGGLRTFSRDAVIEDEKNRYIEDFIYNADKDEVITNMSEWVNANLEESSKKYKAYQKADLDSMTLEEIQDSEFSSIFENAKDNMADEYMENFDADEYMDNIYGGYNWQSYQDRYGDIYYVVSTDGGQVMKETFSYLSGFEGTADTFILSDIPSDDNRNIASKYGKDSEGVDVGIFYKYLAKKRKDLTDYIDQSGFDWYATKITPNDKASVEMFQTPDQIFEDDGEIEYQEDEMTIDELDLNFDSYSEVAYLTDKYGKIPETEAEFQTIDIDDMTLAFKYMDRRLVNKVTGIEDAEANSPQMMAVNAMLSGNIKLQASPEYKDMVVGIIGKAGYMRMFRKDATMSVDEYAMDNMFDNYVDGMNPDEAFLYKLREQMEERQEIQKIVKRELEAQKMLRAEERTKKRLLKRIKNAMDSVVSQRTTEGKKTLQVIKENLMPKSREMVITEKEALKNKIRAFARGYRAGTRETLAEVKNIQNELINRIKTLPAEDRGKINTMKAIRDAHDPVSLAEAYVKIDKLFDIREKKDLITLLKDKLRTIAKSNTIAIDYKKKILDLASDFNMVNHREATLNKLRNLQRMIDEKHAKGESMYLPEQIIKSFAILTRKNITDLSVPELENLIADIQQLEQIGEAKKATIDRLYESEKERIKNEILADVKPIIKKELEKDPLSPLTKKQKFQNLFRTVLNKAQSVNLAIMPMDVFFDYLGGKTGTYKTAVYKYFKEKTDRNYGNYLQMRDSITIPLIKKIQTLGLNENNFNRIGLHAVREQKGGVEKLLYTGITQDVIDSVVLDQKEMVVYKMMREVLDQLRTPVEDVMRFVYNQPLGQVENYFSFMTDFKTMSETEMFRRFGDNVEEVGQPTKNVKAPYAKTRTLGKQKVRIDALNVFLKHVDNVSYMVNMARDNKMLFEVANSEEFGEQAGDIGQRITLEFLDLISRKGGEGGEMQMRWLDTIRRNVGVAYLGFKLSSALIQPTALLDGATLIGRWAFIGATDVATSKETRQYIIKNFPELRNRIGDDPAFMDFGESETFKKIQDAGYFVLKKLDAITASSIAWGAYMKKMKELGQSVDLNSVPNAEALDYAERIVRITQASSQFKDAPMAITRGKLTGSKAVDKALLQFQTFVLSRWANIKYNGWETGVMRGDIKKALPMFTYLTMAFLAEEGLRRLSQQIISQMWGGDDEDDPNKDSYLKSVLNNALGTIPFVSPIVSTTVYDSFPMPSINAPISGVVGVYKLANGSTVGAKARGTVEAVEGFGSVTGIPGIKQISQIAKGFIKSETDEDFQKTKAYNKAYKEWEQSEKTDADKARIEKELIDEISKGEKISDQKVNNIKKEFAILRAYGDDEKAQELKKAKSNEDKVELLKKYREEMGEEEFREFFNNGRKQIKLKSGALSPILISDDVKDIYIGNK